jgi:hypothetical protein
VITIQDTIRGEVSWNTDTLGDFVVLRSNGMPVYNFCVAIDDALMGITHVIRCVKKAKEWGYGKCVCVCVCVCILLDAQCIFGDGSLDV